MKCLECGSKNVEVDEYEAVCNDCGFTEYYKCIHCDSENLQILDGAEGFCPDCGNVWIINHELLEERLEAEMAEINNY